MEEGEAWTAPAGGWATVNLWSLAPVLSGLTYTATNSPAHRSSKQQQSGLQSAEGRGGMGSGVVFKDYSSAFQGDNSSSLQPHLTEIQTRSRSKRCSCAQSRARLQASAALHPPSADGEQPAPLYHLSGQLSRMGTLTHLQDDISYSLLVQCDFPKPGITQLD